MKIFPYDYDLCDFPNGLRLITVPTPYPGVISLQIVVSVGSRNEVEPGRSGFAHFFEHMMFRGTPDYPPERYENTLQQMGAASNAYTDDDRTVYHTTLTTADFEALLAMESDRFQHLHYSEEDFRTEALAVLGEYNKDSAEPVNKLFEVLRDTAFDTHTYKHTTMGFLRDIERMPEMYQYSRQFFDRFYRPEYTTMVVAGDIRPEECRTLVERHWGGWQRGSYETVVPLEAPQATERIAHIDWETHTLPHLMIGYRVPAYSDTSLEWAALDLIGFLGFSEISPLYQKLVIDEQWVDQLWSANADHIDPYLFTLFARVQKPDKVDAVKEEMIHTLEYFASHPVSEEQLERVKKHLRYRYALSLDSSESIASSLAHYMPLRRTPETVNRLYELYEQVTPGDLTAAAAKWFLADHRTVATLQSKPAHTEAPE